MKNYKRASRGFKSIFKFIPHSLNMIQETKQNKQIQKFLVNINLFYQQYNQTPPLEYLAFVDKEFSVNDIKKAIKYLALHDWFSIVKSKNKFSYHITNKFKEAFYHHCGRM